jgi:hypothetical protein
MVDAGSSVRLEGWGGIDVDGTITAPGGSITIVNTRPLGLETNADPGALSIVLGEHARLDAAARAVTALDRLGRAYGVVPDGGLVILGDEGKTPSLSSTDAFVVIEAGASIDVSGTSATIDLSAGLGPAAPARPSSVASDGGWI